MENNKVQLLASLLDADRRWTARELAVKDYRHKTVLHIPRGILGYRKLATCWISHEISEVQQWPVAQALFDR